MQPDSSPRRREVYPVAFVPNPRYRISLKNPFYVKNRLEELNPPRRGRFARLLQRVDELECRLADHLVRCG